MPWETALVDLRLPSSTPARLRHRQLARQHHPRRHVTHRAIGILWHLQYRSRGEAPGIVQMATMTTARLKAAMLTGHTVVFR